MELLLIRHAEPLRVAESEGPADPGLHPRGIEQADRLAAHLAAERVDAVYTSPLRRARQTAAPVGQALGLDVVVDDDVGEFDRDANSYIPMEELRATRDQRFLAMARGELEGLEVDTEAFRTRVVGAMERIITDHPGQRVAVVCHGGVINVYLGQTLGIAKMLWFEPRYASIHRLAAARSGERSIVSLNELDHLRGTGLLVS